MGRGTLRGAMGCLAALALWGCGTGDGPTDRGPADVPGDAVADVADPGADAADLPQDLPQDLPSDAPDGLPGDLPSDAPDGDVPPPVCTWDEVPKGAVDASQTKFALTMWHWNTQYVAGGLLSQWDGQPISACAMLGDDSLCEGWTDDALVDWIITQSFEPILDLYLSHPDWKTTFECPGLMLEAMEARNPGVLAKLAAGVRSGQIELVTFHWSDQLFLAYAARDLERSQALDDEILARTCLPRSPVVFNQEGQDGIGKHRFMAAHGFSVDVMHENLFRYQHWGTTPWPVYESRGVKVVVGMRTGLKEGPQVDPASGIEVAWPFFDDGEVQATPGNPYLAPITSADPQQVKDYEARVQAFADKGFRVTSFTDYLAHLEARGVAPQPLPPLADSTWQPVDTEGIQQWMGRKGRLGDWWPFERDNDERTATYATSQQLAVAGVLLATAKAAGKDVAAIEASLATAWREALMAQVSDATGINPWPGEYVYGITHDAAARTGADAAVAALLAALAWPHAQVDVGAGTATRLDDVPVAEPPEEVDAPLAVTVDAPSRTTDVRWYDTGTDRYELHLAFGSMADPSKPADAANRRVAVTFPRADDVVRYSPGLAEDEVAELDLSALVLQDGKIFLPLANGLLGLGDGWWVVKHNTTVHLAAVIREAEGLPDTVEFADETAIPGESRTWVFTVMKGTAAEALAFARRTNTDPVVYR
jgi:hypothetical protein